MSRSTVPYAYLTRRTVSTSSASRQYDFREASPTWRRPEARRRTHRSEGVETSTRDRAASLRHGVPRASDTACSSCYSSAELQITGEEALRGHQMFPVDPLCFRRTEPMIQPAPMPTRIPSPIVLKDCSASGRRIARSNPSSMAPRVSTMLSGSWPTIAADGRARKPMKPPTSIPAIARALRGSSPSDASLEGRLSC